MREHHMFEILSSYNVVGQTPYPSFRSWILVIFDNGLDVIVVELTRDAWFCTFAAVLFIIENSFVWGNLTVPTEGLVGHPNFIDINLIWNRVDPHGGRYKIIYSCPSNNIYILTINRIPNTLVERYFKSEKLYQQYLSSYYFLGTFSIYLVGKCMKILLPASLHSLCSRKYFMRDTNQFQNVIIDRQNYTPNTDT